MTSTSQQPARSTGDARPAKHVHHGRTPAAWAGSAIALLAFIVGAIGIVVGNMVVFWIAVGMIVVALIVTQVLRKLGYGAD